MCRRAVKIMKKRRLSRIANGEENVRRYSTSIGERERERERERKREREREREEDKFL